MDCGTQTWLPVVWLRFTQGDVPNESTCAETRRLTKSIKYHILVNQLRVIWSIHGPERRRQTMSNKKVTHQRIGRDARTGRFIPVEEAEKRKSTTVVETIRRSDK